MKTINNWKPEVRSFLNRLIKAGVKIDGGNNGEYEFKFIQNRTSLARFVNDLVACDETHLNVTTPNGNKCQFFLVLGNNPGELICDYSYNPADTEFLDKLADEHARAWEGMKQPTLTVE